MWFDTDFGVNNAGIATVGYREVNNAGGDAVARTTTGVVDAGNGMYGVDVTPNANTVSLQWDTGTAFPIYAVESINQFTILDDKIDIIDANVDQLLLDVAAVKAETVLILADTTQLLLDVAALNAQNVLILADTTAIIAQNVLILADTVAIIAQNVLILADTLAILLDTDNIDTLLSDIEDGHDIREMLRLMAASTNNVLSGAEASSTQISLKSLDGLKNRQVTNVDNDGNRLSIVSRDFTP
jgi:hypothetical protein